MTELLTESFCERCGTRYEFGEPEPLSKAQKTRGLVSGLRQFIMSQDTLSDAINDAMKVEEEAIAARQIEAFQETFNFCLECRRYNCANCWNDEAGRCRTCEPLAGIDDYLPVTPMVEAFAPPAAEIEFAPSVPARAWPSEDALPPSAPRPAEPAIIPAAAEQPEPIQELPSLPVEPLPAEPPVEPLPEPLPLAASAEPVAEPAPSEPVQPPRPAPARPRRDLRSTIAPRAPRRAKPASREPVPESLAARRSQLDMLGIEDPGEGTVSVGQREALPYRSSGAGSAAMATLWAASSRMVEHGARRASLRPCGKCGLTVSSIARFCRRCGAPQTLSA